MNRNELVDAVAGNADLSKAAAVRVVDTVFGAITGALKAGDKSQISDGYHTFEELYEHRHALFIALCRELTLTAEDMGYESEVWRSRLHADGSMFDGWFVMGIHKEPGKQITYHLPERIWEQTEFAPTLPRAPEWDGHTSADVVNRILSGEL